MRTDLELLELTLEKLEDYLIGGLCGVISRMYTVGDITAIEYFRLMNILNKNDPRPTNGRMGKAYWFPPGAFHYRVDFLKELIEKAKNEIPKT